jgi:hypothetical protein
LTRRRRARFDFVISALRTTLLPLTRLASLLRAMLADLSPQAGRGELSLDYDSTQSHHALVVEQPIAATDQDEHGGDTPQQHYWHGSLLSLVGLVADSVSRARE